MIRLLISISLTLAVTSCTSQTTYSNQAYIKNTCNQFITLTMRNASNFHSDVINFKLAPDDILVVASYKSYGEHISKQIQDSYRLTVEDINGVKITDGATFRNYLKSAKKSTSGHVRSWLITHSGICP